MGHYVKKIRNARGFSVRQLEYLSGVDNAYISMIENHTRNGLPKISTINKLAKGLNVSPIKMYKIVGVNTNLFSFGSKLKQLRKERHLGVNQLGYLAHISPTTVSKIELDKEASLN